MDTAITVQLNLRLSEVMTSYHYNKLVQMQYFVLTFKAFSFFLLFILFINK